MSKSPFKPAWWLPNSHLQTMWPVLCRRSIKNLPLERERLELPDSDFIDLDWIGDKNAQSIVLVLHGMEGSIESHYAKGILRTIADRGWRGVFMHFRGCSGEPNRLPRCYHSGDTKDAEYVVELLRKRYPLKHIAAVGFSLGGNVLLKWLGETQQNNPLQAATAISVPFELHKLSQYMQTGFAQFYQWYFLRCLRERLSHKYKKQANQFDISVIQHVQTMYEFDMKFTAPLHGFNNADEYYSIASSRQYLKDIQVPTLILHAKDDPFMTVDVIPTEKELSSKVELEVTETGGHVGFVSGKYPWRPEYWLENRIAEFLQQHLSNKLNK